MSRVYREVNGQSAVAASDNATRLQASENLAANRHLHSEAYGTGGSPCGGHNESAGARGASGAAGDMLRGFSLHDSVSGKNLTDGGAGDNSAVAPRPALDQSGVAGSSERGSAGDNTGSAGAGERGGAGDRAGIKDIQAPSSGGDQGSVKKAPAPAGGGNRGGAGDASSPASGGNGANSSAPSRLVGGGGLVI